MDLNKLLAGSGLEAEKIESLIDGIKAEIHTDFVSKKQYAKKTEQVDALEGKVADLEVVEKEDFKTQFNTLTAEFTKYKDGLELEKTNTSKMAAVKEQLKLSGVNEKLIGLLVKEIKIEDIKMENGTITNIEDHINPLKENYADFFTKVQEQGGKVTTPPAGTNRNTTEDPFLLGFNGK